MVSRELFDHYVKDALGNYHDPTHLQVHPLADVFRLKSLSAIPSGAALRQLLRDTVEELRPSAAVGPARPEWISYRLLVLRYLRSYTPQLVCEELGFSLASFYRHHQDALEALSSLLWERYLSPRTAPDVSPQRTQNQGQERTAREEAARVAQQAERQPLDLAGILKTALDMVAALAAQRGLVLRLDCPPTLPKIFGDPAILRQAILNILTQAIERARGEQLHILARAQGMEITCQVGELALSSAEEIEQMAGLAVSRALLEANGGRIGPAIVAGSLWGLSFTVFVGAAQDILIVDDDADTIRLYSRFLEAHGYAVRTARTMEQLQARLAESLPDLVLLDVLMPREDGWDMLSYLKRETRTAHLPVLLCSVLDQPDLGLSLGAAGVLRKPIQEDSLVRAIQSALRAAGSEAPGR